MTFTVYIKIKKIKMERINKKNLPLQALKSPRAFSLYCIWKHIKVKGGEDVAIEKINTVFRDGLLSRKEAVRMRKMIRDACKCVSVKRGRVKVRIWKMFEK